MDENKKKESNISPTKITIAIVVLLLWCILGISAFIMSLVCFGKTSNPNSSSNNVIGLLIAAFFGPFYWIYYFAAKSYCRA